MLVALIAVELAEMSFELRLELLEGAKPKLLVDSTHFSRRRPDEVFVPQLAEVLRRDLRDLCEKIAVKQVHVFENVFLDVPGAVRATGEFGLLAPLCVEQGTPKPDGRRKHDRGIAHDVNELRIGEHLSQD